MTTSSTPRIPLPTNAHLGRVALAAGLAGLVRAICPYNGPAFQAVNALQMVTLPPHGGEVTISTTMEGLTISRQVNHSRGKSQTDTIHIPAYDEVYPAPGIDDTGHQQPPKMVARNLEDTILEGLDWLHDMVGKGI